MIFDAYNFFKPIVDSHDSLTAIYSCTGFAELEGVLSNVRKVSYPILIVEDAPDCNLNIGDTPRSEQHLLMYVICDGGLNNSTKRMKAYNDAAVMGKDLMLALKAHARNTDGFEGINFNEDNITMQRVGPIVNNGYGYSFMYSL